MINHAVHLFLIQQGEVLLLERYNTGHMDGKFGAVTGHIETGESPTTAAIRELREETDLAITADSLEFLGCLHRRLPDLAVYIDFYFSVRALVGSPINTEPAKCSELKWFPLLELPMNLIPYTKVAIQEFVLHDGPRKSFVEL